MLSKQSSIGLNVIGPKRGSRFNDNRQSDRKSILLGDFDAISQNVSLVGQKEAKRGSFMWTGRESYNAVEEKVKAR